jgi:hypothetical protein
MGGLVSLGLRGNGLIWQICCVCGGQVCGKRLESDCEEPWVSFKRP